MKLNFTLNKTKLLLVSSLCFSVPYVNADDNDGFSRFEESQSAHAFFQTYQMNGNPFNTLVEFNMFKVYGDFEPPVIPGQPIPDANMPDVMPAPVPNDQAYLVIHYFPGYPEPHPTDVPGEPGQAPMPSDPNPPEPQPPQQPSVFPPPLFFHLSPDQFVIKHKSIGVEVDTCMYPDVVDPANCGIIKVKWTNNGVDVQRDKATSERWFTDPVTGLKTFFKRKSSSKFNSTDVQAILPGLNALSNSGSRWESKAKIKQAQVDQSQN